MPLNIVFLRPQIKLVSTKTLLLKHYYRRQGMTPDIIILLVWGHFFPISGRWQSPFLWPISALNQRGREKKGPPDIAPKSFSYKGPTWCSAFHRSHRDICTGNRPVSERKFLETISDGPFLSRPLWFTADNISLSPIFNSIHKPLNGPF